MQTGSPLPNQRGAAIALECEQLDLLLREFKKHIKQQEIDRCFELNKEKLVENIKSETGLLAVLEVIKDLALQKALVAAIGSFRVRNMIDLTYYFNQCMNAIHPDYQRDFAVKVIGGKKLINFIQYDHEDKHFRTIIGNDNQVSHLQEAIDEDDAAPLFLNFARFQRLFQFIRPAEKIAFITEYVGIDRFISLINRDPQQLKSVVDELAEEKRYPFLINDIGIRGIKKILTLEQDYKDISPTLPEEHRDNFYAIYTADVVAKNKLEAIRDEIEAAEFVTRLGKLSDTLKGGEEITTRNGIAKTVSYTAARMLENIIKNINSGDCLTTLHDIQQLATAAKGYEGHLTHDAQHSLMGKAVSFAVWASRTNAAQALYVRIAEDKIAPKAALVRLHIHQPGH